MRGDKIRTIAERNGTPTTILRLNYAIDLRYGVLSDIGSQVFASEPVDLSAAGHVNVIWQRDANSVALRSFAHAASPAFVLNLTGARTESVRSIAERFGECFGREARFEGEEPESALLNDAALCKRLFDPETVTLDEMIRWTAAWIAAGGRSLGKPTRFEVRDGGF